MPIDFNMSSQQNYAYMLREFAQNYNIKFIVYA